MKKRITLEVAEDCVQRLKVTRNLEDFICDISDKISWFGRFGRSNRVLFTSDLIDLIKENKIKIKKR